MIELLKAEQRVNAFSTSINQLKTRWQKGELDDSVDIVKVQDELHSLHFFTFSKVKCYFTGFRR